MTDRSSYEKIWTDGIYPLITMYKDKTIGLELDPDAREKIWNEYCSFNKECKERYMKDSSGRLDRHKVCACYIYAIVKAHVISIKFVKGDEERYSVINEKIALSIGLSLLRAFIIRNTLSNENISEVDKKRIVDKIDDGIRLPDCNHGTYELNFTSELYFTRINESYNVLSLANTLFLLEIHNTGIEVLKER